MSVTKQKVFYGGGVYNTVLDHFGSWVQAICSSDFEMLCNNLRRIHIPSGRYQPDWDRYSIELLILSWEDLGRGT